MKKIVRDLSEICPKPERLRYTDEEQAVLDLGKGKEETQKLLQEIWSREDFMNPYIRRWGLWKYNFLMRTERRRRIVARLAEEGTLECLLNKVDRIVTYRALTEETEGMAELLESKAADTEEIEEEIAQLPPAPKADAMFAADSAKYPYLLKREQPYVEDFKLDLYGIRRLNYLLEWNRPRLNSLVQAGEISRHLIYCQTEMREAINRWVAQYLESHPAPPEGDPKRVGYINMTRLQAEEVFRDRYLYS